VKLSILKAALLTMAATTAAMVAASSASAHSGPHDPRAAHEARTEFASANRYIVGEHNSVYDDRLDCINSFRQVRGIGPACRTESGLFRVKLADGTSLFTHGPDFAAQIDGASYTYDPNATPRQPVCANTGEAFKAIIAIPPSVTSDKTVASFRTDINKLNGIFYRAAVESGSTGGSNLRFRCDLSGAVQVDVVRLTTTNASATFATITSELKQAGYNKTNEKYLVHYDAQPGTTNAGGTGSFISDETDSSANWNNVGPSWAVSFDRPGPGILLHELGHNLGAVQKLAPYSTGTGSHCWEGYDVMCYTPDGGDRGQSTIQYNCTDFDHFDCRHDTYFDAKIGVGQGGGVGSYIDKNWNIGECYVRWVQHSACAATSDTTPPTVTAPVERIDVPNTITGTTVPVKLTWSASDVSGIGAYQLWVSTNGGAFVQEPSIASQTQITYSLVIGSTYKFAVRAKDGVGNWSGYAYSQSVKVGVTDNKALSIPFGTWASYSWTSAFGGTATTSSVSGDSVELTFTGRHVALVAPRFSTAGRAKVFCDGADKGYVDLYASSLSGMNTVVACSFTQSASHTIKLVVEGTTNRPRFDVDAFAILS
jgi:hypothetical protein